MLGRGNDLTLGEMLANRARRPPNGQPSGDPSTTPVPVPGPPSNQDGDGDDNDSPEGPRQSATRNGRTRSGGHHPPSNPRNPGGVASPRRSAPQPARKTFFQFLAEQGEANPSRSEITPPGAQPTATPPRWMPPTRQRLAAQRPPNSPNPDTRRPRRGAPQPASSRMTRSQFLMEQSEAAPPHLETTEPRAHPRDPWDEAVRVTPQTREPGPAGPPLSDFQTNFRSWVGDDDLSSDVEAPTAPSATGTRKPTSIRQVAEDASVLLEIFSRTKPKDDSEIDQEHKQMIDDAFNHILQIKEKFRIMAIESKEPPALASDDMKVDAGCIICYNYIADTVLMPCKHLALCTVWYPAPLWEIMY